MSGPMYDFVMGYIFICLFLTLACIQEVHSEVTRIFYVITLIITKIITFIIKYINDCLCRKKQSADLKIFNPISDFKKEQENNIELQSQYGYTRYAIL